MKEQVNSSELTPNDTAPSGAYVSLGEELVLLRSGAWHMLVPMRHVERIYDAALPAAIPSVDGARHPMMTIGGALVPLLFCEALFGGDQVTLDTEDKMVLLRAGSRRALLWVDAVEEIVEHAPTSGRSDRAELSGLIAGFSGTERALPVLDIPKFLELAAAEGTQSEVKDHQGANP
jgi:chemotaxis signal transduction protein